jgi:hypothetical protein
MNSLEGEACSHALIMLGTARSKRFVKAAAGCGRNIGRPVTRSGRGCDSSFVRDGRRANPRPQCRAPLGPMARLGSLRYHCPILGVRSCSVDWDTPQTIGCTKGRQGAISSRQTAISGGFDAKPHLTINQLHHRHDDPIADHDSLTEFARQDQHGGLLPCWLRSERIRQPVPSVREELNERMRKMQIPGFLYGESNMATNIASDKKPPSASPATKLRSMRWRGSSLDWQVLVWLSS